jgi:hypothetical protein
MTTGTNLRLVISFSGILKIDQSELPHEALFARDALVG